MIVPWEKIDTDTLTNLITEFVLREGTDYGTNEISLNEKIDHVRFQLQNGHAVVVFSELHETVDIQVHPIQ
jgi:hypothetical protein